MTGALVTPPHSAWSESVRRAGVSPPDVCEDPGYVRVKTGRSRRGEFFDEDRGAKRRGEFVAVSFTRREAEYLTTVAT
jgi:hypothetical protein